MENIISVKNLTKEYDSNFILKNITFEVKKGEIFALLGRNGVGKTTLLKLLCGLLEPTEGEVFIFEKNLGLNKKNILKSIGIMIDKPIFYEHLTAYENIAIHLEYMQTDANIKEILNLVGLNAYDKKPVSKFSFGMRQKLGIARAISHNPKLLLLDEPMNGLDPVAIRTVRALFVNLKEKETTVILSSHILSEILQTAESIAVLSNGKMDKLGCVEKLQEMYNDKLEDFLIERMEK